MKTSKLKITLSALLITSSLSLFAQTPTSVDLSWNLKNKELIYTKYFQVTKDLNDLNSIEALKAWINRMNSETQNLYVKTYMPKVYQEFKTQVRSKKILELAAHYYYTKNKEQFVSALSYYYWQAAMFLQLNATDPRLAANESPKVESARVAQEAFRTLTALESCLNSSYKPAGQDAFADLKSIKSSCINNNANLQSMMRVIFDLIQDRGFRGSPALTNASGFIPGNKIEQLTQNNTSPEMVGRLAQLNVAFKTAVNSKIQKKYLDMTVEDFKNVMSTKESALEVFTENGLPTSFDPNAANGHPIFKLKLPNNSSNSFGEVYAAVSKARQSIYIDVYFFGASMGAMMAKKIIHQMQTNPNLKVVILNDRNNAMAYNTEMQPVFHYMRAYAEKFGEGRMMVLVPKIDLKRTSLPAFVDLLVSDEDARRALGTQTVQGLLENNKVYPKAKSDHSKVYLIDALDAEQGVAFVGSKNMTDSSGGVSYDEITKIQGPAAAMIQDSYYHDIKEAIRADAVFSKANSAPLLNAFDAIGRSGTQKQMTYPVKGSGVISVAENNVYGSIRTPLVQDIEAIMGARKQIIISEQFVYDPYIVKALIEAKRAAVGRGERLEIYILLATINGPLELQNGDLKFAHVPNILFLRDLMAAGIQVRWKKESPAMVQALQQAKDSGAALSPEYHLKTISVDGVLMANKDSCRSFSNETQVVEDAAVQQALTSQMDRLPLLISGSANKDNMTMIGGFREFQVAVYDKVASAKHDCLFWSRWTNPNSSREVKVEEQFQIPENLRAKGVSNMQMLDFLKEFFLGVYNFSVEYF